MIHRYVAGTLGLFILGLAIWRFNLVSAALVALVLFQALLGMWTVTLGLYPIVVMGHLLGGFAILATLWLYYLHFKKPSPIVAPHLKTWGWLALTVLILQIALGGWTSANYAALVCADFPSCQGSYWPTMDVTNAFNFSQVGVFASPGIPLENTARVTIQMFHRLGALITLLILGILGFKLMRHKINLGYWLLCILFLQIGLGISNVLSALPLAVSLMHSACAALLLLTLLTILYRAYAK